MFGNDKELNDKSRLLNEAFLNWAKVIIALDPAIRKLQIDDYKDYIARYEADYGEFSMSLMGKPKEAVKDLYVIYKNVLEIVEEAIKDEAYEGENYIWGSILGVKSEIIDDQNSLINKRLRQVGEDFPEILSDDADEDEDDDDDDENLESFMESLENDLESITKKEEGKESDQDLKPTSDKAFSDSINEFLMANAAAIISANYWTLAEIKSHVDPETWEEDPDHLESVISNYKLFSNKDDLLEWINERIDLYEDMGSLDKFLSIGEAEECDYPDAESFLEALDCDYIIGVLDICWAKACTIS